MQGSPTPVDNLIQCQLVDNHCSILQHALKSIEAWYCTISHHTISYQRVLAFGMVLRTCTHQYTQYAQKHNSSVFDDKRIRPCLSEILCRYVCMYTCLVCAQKNVPAHVCTYVCGYVLGITGSLHVHYKCACLYVWLSVCMTCMHACIVCVCVYVHMYACP